MGSRGGVNVGRQAADGRDLLDAPAVPVPVPPAGQTASETVTAADLTRAVVAGRRRAHDLLDDLQAALLPVLNAASDAAAAAFVARVHSFTAAAPPAGGKKAMVAVYPKPDEADALAHEGGYQPAELHCTLAFLGDVEDDDLPRLVDIVRQVAGQHPALTGTISGVGVFAEGADGYPGVLHPSVPGLLELRHAVTVALAQAGVDYSRAYGFIPHITVHYSTDDDLYPSRAVLGLPCTFEALHIVRANVEVARVPFAGVPSLTADGEPPSWAVPDPNEILDVAALVAALRGKTDPVRLAVVETMHKAVLRRVGLSFDVSNPFTAAVLRQSGSQVVGIAETTQLNVMRIIRHAYEQGLSIPATASAIQEGMQEASVARALLIARTEMVGAVSGGSLAAVQIASDAGAGEFQKQWLTAPGAKYPRHETYDDLDGQTVGLEEAFQVGDSDLQYPGDPGGDIEETANCRCTLVYVDATGNEADPSAVPEGELAPEDL